MKSNPFGPHLPSRAYSTFPIYPSQSYWLGSCFCGKTSFAVVEQRLAGVTIPTSVDSIRIKLTPGNVLTTWPNKQQYHWISPFKKLIHIYLALLLTLDNIVHCVLPETTESSIIWTFVKGMCSLLYSLFHVFNVNSSRWYDRAAPLTWSLTI